jgi:hypothetical protein
MYSLGTMGKKKKDVLEANTRKPIIRFLVPGFGEHGFKKEQ